MAAEKAELLNNDKSKQIYPKTLTECVYDREGNRLDNTLEEIEQNLTEINNGLVSQNAPKTATIRPYGSFDNITGIDMAIQGDTLYIRCFDKNGTITKWLKFTGSIM